ncbi:hypothetical protein EFU43_18590 [Vibrio cholerae]|nr:hypothetical protein [Vibrio cholerae]HDZ9474079.1 hypothetical protein [Vibrio cholerae]
MSLHFEVEAKDKDNNFAVAEARHMNAMAADQETLTELKKNLAGQTMFFMWFWFGALCLLVLTYCTYLLGTGKEIPKEIIIAAFTSSTVVVGLVGFILKGLFGTK